LARAKGPLLGCQFNRLLDQPPVQLVGDQALAEGNQRAFTERRLTTVEAIQDELPAPIHRSGLDGLIVGDPSVGLQDRRQGQLGWGDRGLTEWAVLVERRQFCLKGIGEQFMSLFAQEHEQFGPANPFDNRLFGWGGQYRRMPECWTHAQTSFVFKIRGSKTCAQHSVNHPVDYLTGILATMLTTSGPGWASHPHSAC
jgi:hypothetical protein